MAISKTKFHLIALAFILSLASATFAQDNITSEAQTPNDSARIRIVAVGEKLKIRGIVIKRNADTFTLREPDGTETEVVLTSNTSIKADRPGWFHPDRNADASYILRGLRLKVEGRSNSDGQLVAENVRFLEQDLRTAQALDARVDPVFFTKPGRFVTGNLPRPNTSSNASRSLRSSRL